ncbi:MAG: hypothetical protein ACLP5V_02035 [Candidatus Bathyarchaeia archaeon]
MKFEIQSEGLDKIETELDELQKGLTLPILQNWAKRIESEAKMLGFGSKAPRGIFENIRLQVSESEPKTFEVTARANKRALPFIAKATQRELPRMPLTAQAIFESFLEELESSRG